MPKLKHTIQRGDGATYESEVDVTEEGAKELSKLDDYKRGESKGKDSIVTDEETALEAGDDEYKNRMAGALTEDEKKQAETDRRRVAAVEASDRKTAQRRGRKTETSSRRASEKR